MDAKPRFDVFVFEPLRTKPEWPFMKTRVFASWKNCTDVKENEPFNGITFITASGVFTAIDYDAAYTIGICYLGTPQTM